MAAHGLLRVPLYIKVAVSYLVVVGLVLVPTFVHLRTILHEELRGGVLAELERTITGVSMRLSATPPEQLEATVRLLQTVLPERITVVDPQGRVLGDTAVHRGPPDHHAERPEIIEALTLGRGRSVRFSQTVGETLIYAAMRFPSELRQPARGVVRLAMPTKVVDQAEYRASDFVYRAGGVALSVATLLSLLAAIVVSRPLKRIAAGARAFAAGDFGEPIAVTSGDELGEVAQALSDLASQLRDRLVSAGADRATLRSLVEHLPIGVILYNEERMVGALNSRAREICALSLSEEHDLARKLLDLPGQAPLIQAAVQHRLPLDTTLDLPWQPDRHVRARWIPMPSPSPVAQLALVVLDDSGTETQLTAMRRLLTRSVALLRQLRTQHPAPLDGDRELATALLHLLEEAEPFVLSALPNPGDLSAIELAELCATAREQLRPLTEARRLRVLLDVDDPTVRVIEAQERTARALVRLLNLAVDEAEEGATVRLQTQVFRSKVRLSVRVASSKRPLEPLIDLVSYLGGDAGYSREGELADAWLLVPRA
jgi:two-component system phosphate regulon sensor histidine kinase PhoR